ncbi:protein phosphatase 2C domain-containing protein, partial [Streptomyces stramineus]|uniref:protein phosphatase 2C domain-containing protein n=1 Tax=Streptomyces stramineus TaxID=173861 RepID=UPI0031DF5471
AERPGPAGAGARLAPAAGPPDAPERTPGRTPELPRSGEPSEALERAEPPAPRRRRAPEPPERQGPPESLERLDPPGRARRERPEWVEPPGLPRPDRPESPERDDPRGPDRWRTAAEPPGRQGPAEGAESLERVDPPNGRIPMPRQTGPRRPGEPRRPLVPRQQARPGPGPVDYVGERPPTYDAEPTSWPATDPGGLADLVPDTVLDGARYGAVTLRAVSLRGDSARYRGEQRRDALLTARFGEGDSALLFVAMASPALAAVEAHRAARDICAWLGGAVGRSHARLADDIRGGRRGELGSGLHRLTDRSYGRLRARAAELGLRPEEYTAAVRCLLLTADGTCRTRVFFGVGGGGLFRLREGLWQDLDPDPEPGRADPPGEITGGRGAGDRTTLDLGIPTPGLTPVVGPAEVPGEPFRFRASVARPGDTLLLCSTGLAEPLRGERELGDRLAERWSAGEPPGLAAFLADTQLRVKGYADDRTACALWEA